MDEIDKFQQKQNLLKLTQDEIGNLNSSVLIKLSMINKENPSLDGFTGNSITYLWGKKSKYTHKFKI